nr:MAG TPA: Radical SAM superfamily [Caudoviricetes sp.]
MGVTRPCNKTCGGCYNAVTRGVTSSASAFCIRS